ncbi:MAG TPA: SDR family NAD(P)-dependent oxidoreductase [Candidatus Deferrimicrobiaceae bacterium]|nr:SDR family NAD(P)-dependent oxidoreductase [Candidatus Deferrimicrobiaceae bacterium]
MKLSSTAVITGVSTGIGYETARTLAEKGFHVFGGVRSTVDADRLKAELGGQFTPLPDSSIGCWPNNLNWRRTVDKIERLLPI